MDCLNVFQHFTGNPGDPNLIAVILAFWNFLLTFGCLYKISLLKMFLGWNFISSQRPKESLGESKNTP